MQTSRRRRIEDIVHVLGLALDLPARHEIALQHAIAVHFQDAALGKTAAYGRPHGGRIGPAGLRQQQGFRHDVDGPADNQLIAQLGQLAATGAAYQRGTPHCREHRPGAAKIGRIATGHDGQAALLRAQHAAGNRRIDAAHAMLRQHRMQGLRLALPGRTHVDHEAALAQARQRRLQHLRNDGAGFQHGDHDIGIGHRFGRRGDDPRAKFIQRFCLGTIAVPRVERVAGLQQAARHRLAHQADAEKCQAWQCGIHSGSSFHASFRRRYLTPFS